MFKENCISEVKQFNKLNTNKILSANKLIGIHEFAEILSFSPRFLPNKQKARARETKQAETTTDFDCRPSKNNCSIG